MNTGKNIRSLLLALMVSAATMGAAHAQAVSYKDTPLMVVRFNQERVYYQQQLYNAVSRALEAKPDVQFSIISLVPETQDRSYNRRMQDEARHNTGLFVANMVKMGFPKNRIRIAYQIGPSIESNEVHMFVE
ncbi:MAG: hypothetical protein MK052_00755 [Alphaproteobacteria bacterium]|nr:hypothetical protein [Alphaproteobacteria bacterium]